MIRSDTNGGDIMPKAGFEKEYKRRKEERLSGADGGGRKRAIVRKTEYTTGDGSPLFVMGSVIYADVKTGRTFVKLKLRNDSGLRLKAAYLNLKCYDAQLNGFIIMNDVIYSGLDVEKGGIFGREKEIAVSAGVEAVETEVTKLIYENGSVWIRQSPAGKGRKDDLKSVRYDKKDKQSRKWEKDYERKRKAERRKKKAEQRKRKRRARSRKSKIAAVSAIVAAVVLIVCGAFSASVYFSRRSDIYASAMTSYINRNFARAYEEFGELDGYWFMPETKLNILYSRAVSAYRLDDFAGAMRLFYECGEYRNARDCARSLANRFSECIAAGYNHSVAVRKDGTVLAAGDNEYGQCNVGDWTDVRSVAAAGNHTVALKNDGTLYAVGNNDFGQCEVGGWSDITAIAASEYHTVGLRENGRVIARGNNRYGQCDVQDWKDIVQIAAGPYLTIGLKADGTVVTAGWGTEGEDAVSSFSGIGYVSTEIGCTVGIGEDGSVAAVGNSAPTSGELEDLSGIITASVGNEHAVFLTYDGKAEAKGDDSMMQSSTTLWRDLAAVQCGTNHTIGLKWDGTVVAVGDDRFGQCDVSEWNDIGFYELDLAVE